TTETRLMLAWLDANSGQAEKARQRIEGLEPQNLGAFWRVCLEIINATIQVGNASPQRRQKVAREEFDKLRAARNWRGIRAWRLCFRRMFRGSIRVLNWRGRFWALRMTWRWPWTAGG